MATPLVFTKVTTWVDLTDPANIPPGAKLITAADLLRYENGIEGLVNRVNSHDADIITLQGQRVTDSGNITTLQGQRVTDSGNITTLQGQMTTANNNIAALQRTTLVASTAQALAATVENYIHTGGAVVSTLPLVAGNTGKRVFIKNRGTGTLTINAETNKMWNTSVVTGLALVAGSGVAFVNDGTYWVRLY